MHLLNTVICPLPACAVTIQPWEKPVNISVMEVNFKLNPPRYKTVTMITAVSRINGEWDSTLQMKGDVRGYSVPHPKPGERCTETITVEYHDKTTDYITVDVPHL